MGHSLLTNQKWDVIFLECSFIFIPIIPLVLFKSNFERQLFQTFLAEIEGHFWHWWKCYENVYLPDHKYQVVCVYLNGWVRNFSCRVYLVGVKSICVICVSTFFYFPSLFSLADQMVWRVSGPGSMCVVGGSQWGLGVPLIVKDSYTLETGLKEVAVGSAHDCWTIAWGVTESWAVLQKY